MSVLRGIGEALVPKIVRQIAAPIILLMLLLYYYVNGPLLFPGLWDEPGFGNAILAYILFVFASFLLAVVPPGDPIAGHLFKPVSGSLLIQFGGFAVVAVVVNTLIALSGFELIDAVITDIVQVALFQLAVAGAEELLFRGAMFRFGPLISTGAFAGFHAYVYSASPAFLLAIIVAGIAGAAFYYIYAATKDRFGLAINTGAHFGYNTGLLGAIFIGPLLSAFFG